jgi:phosphoribosylaminoimidazolecarboxamide formyltransferase/IMP cyclohydrolase
MARTRISRRRSTGRRRGARAQLASQLQGKDLSYNNLVDADTAFECVRQFAARLRHRQACQSLRVAVAATARGHDRLPHRSDSGFRRIIAFIPPTAPPRVVLERQFVEVLIVPAAPEARSLRRRTMYACSHRRAARTRDSSSACAAGCWPPAIPMVGREALQVDKACPMHRARHLMFIRQVASSQVERHVFARDGATVGIGAGQMSRVVSCRIAGMKARDEGIDPTGSVMASDAFFPFRDGLDAAILQGITAVIQPGGSKRDIEVIAAADENELAMVFTGMRHFRH